MNIPGWVGPIFGPILGVLFYFRAIRKSGEDIDIGLMLMIAAVGLVAGCIVWLVDVRRKRKGSNP